MVTYMSDDEAPGPAAELRRAERAGQAAEALAGSSLRWVATAAVAFAAYLACAVALLGVFRNSGVGFVVTIATIPVLASTLVYAAQRRLPALAHGLKRVLSAAGIAAGLIGLLGVAVLMLQPAIPTIVAVPIGVATGLPFAIAGVAIHRKERRLRDG
jgi:hypothetical protein